MYNHQKIKLAQQILRALNHKLRSELINYIEGNPRSTVTEIYTHFKIDQSVASQHLSILRRINVVATERSGKEVKYSVNKPRLQHIESLAEEIIK